ncbi:Peptidyl-prolyl isomerase cwc27 [Sparganum proliferum]
METTIKPAQSATKGFIVRDSRDHAILELTHHLSESFATVEFLLDFPQYFTIHRVEGFRQIHESGVQVGLLLLTLLLQLTCDEDNVRGSTMTAKAALTFRQKTMFQVVGQAVEKDASEDPPGDVQQGDALVVVAELAVSFPLIQMADCGVLEILRDFSLTPPLLE